MEAPSYPFSQKTFVAWMRISDNRRSKRVAGCAKARGRREETRLAVEGLAKSPNQPHSNVRSDPVNGNTIYIVSRVGFAGFPSEPVSLLVPYIRQESLY